MKKLIIALFAVICITIIEIFALVYQVDGIALSAAIGAIASIATWRTVKSIDGRKHPPG